METTKCAPDSGRALYNAVWKLVGANFFDAKRLTDWSSWEHRFDDQILDEETALSHIDQMLASLKDPYTERVVSKPVSPVGQSAETVEDKDKPATVLALQRPDGIGYLRILDFDSEEIFAQIEAALPKIAGCSGLVIDLRANSGGRMHRAIQAASLFIDDGLLTTVEVPHEGGGVEQRQYCVSRKDFFCVTVSPDGSRSQESYERPAPIMFGKPTVILVHRRTASAAEMFACALLQNGIPGWMMSVGGETAGKGIGQAEFDVDGGSLKIRISRSRWLTPSGHWVGDCRQTFHDSIEPDVVVSGDKGPEGLQAAFAEINKMLGRDKQ